MWNRKYLLVAYVTLTAVLFYFGFSDNSGEKSLGNEAKLSIPKFLEAVSQGYISGGEINYPYVDASLVALKGTFRVPPAKTIETVEVKVEFKLPESEVAVVPSPTEASKLEENAEAKPSLFSDDFIKRNTSKAVISEGLITPAQIEILREKGFTEKLSLKAAQAEQKAARNSFWNILNSVVGLLLPVLLIIILASFILSRRNSGAKAVDVSKTNVSFASVAGCDEAKEEVKEIVDYLRNPAEFTKMGGKMPKGILLVGPPGTGKTLLAKAVAGEAGVPFFSLSGSDFVEMFVGVGAMRVRRLFKQARKKAPCIIFIDEIDAVGKQRGNGPSNGGTDERDQTLNALLVAMDGFEGTEGIIIFAATNRAEMLDEALLRPGRFDRRVTVDLPDIEGRKAILAVHSRNLKLSDTVDLGHVARNTPGFSGASLANLLNEAALHAARNKHTAIEPSDIEEAREKIAWGRERKRLMTPKDRRVIAVHEAGHALMQLCEPEEGSMLHKATILPRGQSLGSTHFGQEHDIINFSRKRAMARLLCYVGGRAAEDVLLGETTSGASGDIKEASRIARLMIHKWGMSSLGFLDLDDNQLMSDGLLEQADEELKQLLAERYARAVALCKEYKASLTAISNELDKRETLTGDEIRAIHNQYVSTQTSQTV